MWLFATDLFQLLILHDDLNRIGVDKVVDLQLFGFAEHLDFGDLQLSLIQLFAALFGEIAQRKAIIFHLGGHLIEAICSGQLAEQMQIAAVGNDWILSLVTPLGVVVRPPDAKDLGSVGQSFIWC